MKLVIDSMLTFRCKQSVMFSNDMTGCKNKSKHYN